MYSVPRLKEARDISAVSTSGSPRVRIPRKLALGRLVQLIRAIESNDDSRRVKCNWGTKDSKATVATVETCLCHKCMTTSMLYRFRCRLPIAGKHRCGSRTPKCRKIIA